jgi:tRNA pseudouridine55 synthase
MPARQIRIGTPEKLTLTKRSDHSAPPPGVLIIDKPGGITSHGVVSVVRRTIGTRKVGHAGTLDPMATGVLVIGIGQATKVLGHLAMRDKEYFASIRLGAYTSTDDREGDLYERVDGLVLASISDASVMAAVSRYVGKIHQVPSSISAIKVDGQRAYARVRAGEDLQLKAREVEITAFDVLSIVRSNDWLDIDVRVECSTGTYIRALARDIGKDLEVGGHLIALRRSRVGPFSVAVSHELVPWSEGAEPETAIVPLSDVARAAFTCIKVDDEHAADITHGRRIEWPDSDSAVIALLDDSGSLLALAEEREGRCSYLCVFVSAAGS